MITPEMLKDLILHSPIDIRVPELDPHIQLAKMKKASYDDADREFRYREHINSGLYREIPRKAETPRAPTAIERLNEQNL